MKKSLHALLAILILIGIARAWSLNIPAPATQQDAMIIKTFPTGLYQSNVYVVSDGKDGFIVDAGSNHPAIGQYIKDTGIKIHTIILTHAHIDHALFAMELKAQTGAEIIMHKNEVEQFALHTPQNIQRLMAIGLYTPDMMPMIENFLKVKADRLLLGDEKFTVGSLSVQIIPTPGHTSGSISLLVNNKDLFSGDTLFLEGIGRTDLATGDAQQIIASIKNTLFALPDETRLFAGHGPSGSLADAKIYLSRGFY